MKLGGFALQERIGSGASGNVWRAVHEPTGALAAVKVALPSVAREAWRRRAFAEEIRAVAGLDHPGVVRVFDLGNVSAEAATASRGALPRDAPWLAMEHASGGTLSDVGNRPASYAALAELLDAVLSALAHAHARGLLHRDVKLSNVLVAGPRDLRRGWILADFGLALRHGQAPPAGTESAGTPGYWAPEQRFGDWQSFGPWTDLYAVGVVVGRLLRGRAWRPGEPLDPGFDVPPALEGWVERLLADEPGERFATAGAARRALPGLPRRPRPFVPPAPALATLGLPLLDLRRPRLVGRARERRALLAAYGRVVRSRRPELVAIVGEPGVGRTALLEWACETLAAREGARIVRDAPSAVDGPVVVALDDATSASAGGVVELLGARGPVLVLAVWHVAPAAFPVPHHVVPLRRLRVDRLARVATGWLPLERATAVRLATAASGRPAHARLLLSHWARSGALALSGAEWRLSAAPAPTGELRAAIEGVVAEAGDGAALALATAAALGPRVRHDVWERAAGAAPRRRVAALLVERGHAVERRDGLELAPTFAEAARELYADRAVHALCATALEGERDPASRVDRACHLAGSGRPDLVWETLLPAVQPLADAHRYETLLRASDVAVAALGDDPRSRAAREWRVSSLFRLGAVAACAEAGGPLYEEALEACDRGTASRVAQTLACNHQRSDPAAAEAWVRRALDAAGGEPSQDRWWARATLAAFLLQTDRPAEARAALAGWERIEPASEVRSYVTWLRGTLAESDGDDEAARALYEESLRHLAPGTVPAALNSLGDLHRRNGRLAEARRWYLEALDRVRPLASGPGNLLVTLLNLAVLELEAGDSARCRAWLEEANVADGAGGPPWSALVDLVTATCAAEDGDWAEVDLRVARFSAVCGRYAVLAEADPRRLLRRLAARAEPRRAARLTELERALARRK